MAREGGEPIGAVVRGAFVYWPAGWE